jgi:predicted ATPase
MTTSAIRKKLVSYLQIADDKKLKAIYTMVADEINTIENDWDEDFINEMETRSRTFRDGTAKMYTWEETKQAAIDSVASNKK